MASRAGSPVRSGNALCLVGASDPGSPIGWATDVTLAGGGEAFDVSFLWTEPAGATRQKTFCYVHEPFSDWYSIVFVPGLPAGGSLGTLFDVPTWNAADFWLHDQLGWQLFDAEVPHVMLNVVVGQNVVWKVLPPPNATSLTVPLPPSPVDPQTVFGPALEGQLVAGTLDERWIASERFAVSERIVLRQ